MSDWSSGGGEKHDGTAGSQMMEWRGKIKAGEERKEKVADKEEEWL